MVGGFPVEGAENWWASPWFGNFYLNEDSGWLMHEELGWLFAIGHPADGVWLWQEDLGWMWTHSPPIHFSTVTKQAVGCFFTVREHKGFCFLITAKISG